MNATDAARAVVERYRDAWVANDLTAMLDCYSDEFTLHYFGNNPFTGDHVGKESAIETLLEVAGRAPRSLDAVDEILAGPDAALMVVRESISFGGETHQIRRVLRYRINDGRLTECWLYEENQDLIDRAWSTPPAAS